MPELKGKVALVTGGGGGLGEAICQVLGEAGIHVIAADVREAQVQKVAQAAKARGFQCTPLQLDITQESQIEQALHRVLQQHDRLDILVNNAGVDVTAPV